MREIWGGRLGRRELEWVLPTTLLGLNEPRLWAIPHDPSWSAGVQRGVLANWPMLHRALYYVNLLSVIPHHVPP